MKTNDIKKGMRVKLRHTGWEGTMMDNRRGDIRVVDVEGWFRETGSVYAHDIVLCDPDGSGWVRVEHTQSQMELMAVTG